MEKFYITTTLPYVNAAPHIGFALEIVHADIIARYHRMLGHEVFFNTGTDEHGLKIYRKAQEEGKEPQVYVDEWAARFKKLQQLLNISDDLHFIRTTDLEHMKAAQEFWRRCDKAGYIYKKVYEAKYCVGCELEKTDSELADGHCPLHPNLELEIINEENYFFKFSAFQKPLLELYEKYPDFVIPASRLKEIRTFVEGGLQDFSISRLKEKMPWGVPVPNDDKQVMYVWFDALVNYISTLGWPNDTKKFEEFWGTKEEPRAVQIAGKDNLRQQSAIWQAMLMAADLPASRHIWIHGFITSNGQKMSKSLGNVIDPAELIEKLKGLGLSADAAIDAFRYWLAREANTFEDSDYTWEKFVESYNANLANGLGNYVSRLVGLVVSDDVWPELEAGFSTDNLGADKLFLNYKKALANFNVKEGYDLLFAQTGSENYPEVFDNEPTPLNEPYISGATGTTFSVSVGNLYIQKSQLFNLGQEERKEKMQRPLKDLRKFALMIEPILPTASKRIMEVLKNKTKLTSPLFPRIS